MEEKIYNRKGEKESLAGHLIDEQLFERCIRKENLMLYDFTNLNQELKERPNMSFFTLDEHKLLAELINEESENIWSVHIQQLQQQHYQLQPDHQHQLNLQHQLK